MKKICFFMIIIFCFTSFSWADNFSSSGTKLIIVETKENNKLLASKNPITDGIYEALWDRESNIFFDMPIKKPISSVDEVLDFSPFVPVAKESGAESILLIKFHYSSKREDGKFRVEADKISFNLYSLSNSSSVASGEKEINVSEFYDRKSKAKVLRKIGYDLLNEIYK